MQSGVLRDSRLASVVSVCCEPLASVKLLDDYDFESIAAAIHDADELIREADALAGKLEGREAAIRAVRRVVVSVAQAVAPSRRLRTSVIQLTERILALDEIAMPIQWPPDVKDEFYNAAIWGQREVDRLLAEYCTE